MSCEGKGHLNFICLCPCFAGESLAIPFLLLARFIDGTDIGAVRLGGQFYGGAGGVRRQQFLIPFRFLVLQRCRTGRGAVERYRAVAPFILFVQRQGVHGERPK